MIKLKLHHLVINKEERERMCACFVPNKHAAFYYCSDVMYVLVHKMLCIVNLFCNIELSSIKVVAIHRHFMHVTLY